MQESNSTHPIPSYEKHWLGKEVKITEASKNHTDAEDFVGKCFTILVVSIVFMQAFIQKRAVTGHVDYNALPKFGRRLEAIRGSPDAKQGASISF